MSIDKRYSPNEVESKWYQHWMDSGYFNSDPDDRESYSIVIPPPNVTGVLHMGHMLNNTIQDILIRKARLDGKNACWVPGTDHASIATEAKVVRMLREKGIKKSDLTREEFLKHAFEWKDKYGGIILDQLKRLGASCDWRRTRFTMEDKLSKAVVKVFVDLHKKGKLYRGYRMTNWDPEALTVLSNEEVIYKEENTRLFYVNYPLEDGSGHITIATTRPETILGDTAVSVNPEDDRYKHLHGKMVRVPLTNRVVPIIADRYVDMEFGTGALKITPAHDMNDYEIGQRHKLETIDTLNANGTMSALAGEYAGLDRKIARKKMGKELEVQGFVEKIEDYRHKVGFSERTNVVIEPRLTLQWFVDMKSFASTALNAVEEGDVKFYPEHFVNMYHSWLKEENVRDWCISRQLWWGQQIPAYYLTHNGEELVFVSESIDEALIQAREQTGRTDLKLEELRQDEDVVDTWFSSWLWPISVFDGFDHTEELKYYYPTNVLVTGWDIMFFWVARMIMAGYEWTEELLGKHEKRPFQDVYFTGMVRDKMRRKMSKSLGNSPDALALLDTYGADGVRFGMLSCAAAGNDIIFDAPFGPDGKSVLNESQLCEQGTKFCNKMWNALRLINGLDVDDQKTTPAINDMAIRWMSNLIEENLKLIQHNFDQYRLSDVLMSLYSLIWDDFCSWFLEMIKPAKDESIDKSTHQAAISIFERLMTLLHPFMPFVTEEIWHQLKSRAEGEDCMRGSWPKSAEFDKGLIADFAWIKKVISGIRELRNSNGLKMREELPLGIQISDESTRILSDTSYYEILDKLAYVKPIEMVEETPSNALSFQIGTTQFYVTIEQEIDAEAECAKLKEELTYQEGFLNTVRKKLGNERFVQNAPEAVVNNERKKEADALARIENLKNSIQELGG